VRRNPRVLQWCSLLPSWAPLRPWVPFFFPGRSFFLSLSVQPVENVEFPPPFFSFPVGGSCRPLMAFMILPSLFPCKVPEGELRLSFSVVAEGNILPFSLSAPRQKEKGSFPFFAGVQEILGTSYPPLSLSCPLRALRILFCP